MLWLVMLLISTSGYAEALVEYELDPYYTNVGLYVPLTDKDIQTVDLGSEEHIYSTLLKDYFTPRFFLLEASVNPLPWLGTVVRRNYTDAYQDAEVSADLNLIEALTEGFEEPYALSFFVGNIIRFKLAKEKKAEAINKGYSGFVISVGDRHIKKNTLIDDHWYEIEWKLKGDRRIGPIYHSWSFRIGTKIHDNPEISDVSYFGIRRELFNRELKGYKFLQNTGIDVRVDFSNDNSNLVQSVLYVEKRWNRESGVFTMGIGVKRTTDKYRGSLADDGDQTRLILRPGYLF